MGNPGWDYKRSRVERVEPGGAKARAKEKAGRRVRTHSRLSVAKAD